MTGRTAGRRVALILQYEPSWFAEFMSAVGIFLWACFAFETDDFVIRGWAWFMPVAGLVFGPIRVLLLFHLEPLPRVLAAALGFVWWSWLSWALWQRMGVVPAHGAFMALVVGDLLTVSKFSITAHRLRRFPVPAS